MWSPGFGWLMSTPASIIAVTLSTKPCRAAKCMALSPPCVPISSL